MPRAWLLAFIDMLPRLEAERALMDSTTATLPHLGGKRGAATRRRIIDTLQRQAAGRRDSGTPVARTGEELRQWLARVGGIDARYRRGPSAQSPELSPILGFRDSAEILDLGSGDDP